MVHTCWRREQHLGICVNPCPQGHLHVHALALQLIHYTDYANRREAELYDERGLYAPPRLPSADVRDGRKTNGSFNNKMNRTTAVG